MENLLINDYIIYNLFSWNKTILIRCYHPLHYILASISHGLCNDFVHDIVNTVAFWPRPTT